MKARGRRRRTNGTKGLCCRKWTKTGSNPRTCEVHTQSIREPKNSAQPGRCFNTARVPDTMPRAVSVPGMEIRAAGGVPTGACFMAKKEAGKGTAGGCGQFHHKPLLRHSLSLPAASAALGFFFLRPPVFPFLLVAESRSVRSFLMSRS
jgi:hypothetical protein